MEMESQVIIVLVVAATTAAHVVLYKWVKFKIQEGVILKLLREESKDGLANSYRTEQTIVRLTNIPGKRVAMICRKSRDIQPASQAENSWRAVDL